MITDYQIVFNQIQADLRQLRADTESGLYRENTEAFEKEVRRINEKMDKLEFMKEQELTDLSKEQVWEGSKDHAEWVEIRRH